MNFLEEIKNEGDFVETVKVPLGDEGEADVDVFIMRSPPEKKSEEYSDPFEKVAIDTLPANLKRKVKRQGATASSKAMTVDQIIGYDVLQVVNPPYNLLQLAKLYELDSTHNAAVTIKATNICGLGHRWIETPATLMAIEKASAAGDTQLQKLMDAIKIKKMKLEEDLASFNDDKSFDEITHNIQIDVESLGNGYLEIGRNRNGSIGYLGHVAGQTMRVRALRDGFVQMFQNRFVFFRNYGDQDTLDPLKQDDMPNEVIHFSKYSPNSSYYGIPDIIPAMPAVAGNKLAQEYNLDYFENKAVPRYAFILKGAKLSQKAEQILINYFRNEVKGKHHGTLYIPLPASIGQQVDAEFKALETGVQESSFIDYIKLNRQEILMTHRVPPGKVGITEGSNLAVSRDADKTFKEQVCAPEKRRAENRVNKLMAELTQEFKIEFLESDIIDADIKSRIHDRYARIQVMSPNAIKTEIGQPTTPEGNAMLPYMKGPNEGGPGQLSAEGAKPRTKSPADQTGTRQVRGQAQDKGEEPAK